MYSYVMVEDEGKDLGRPMIVTLMHAVENSLISWISVSRQRMPMGHGEEKTRGQPSYHK